VAGNVTIVPTTTLQAETANNSAAPNTISGSTNGIATSGNISKQPFRDMMYSGANTQVYTTLLGWFGESGHISVGYNSQDPAQVAKQIADMKSRGIDGTFLAWYGADAYEEGTNKILKQQAELVPGFSFADMIDHGTITWDSRGLTPTNALIYHMNYLAQNYYSSPAYLHLNGRPVVMEFGMELENIDWNAVHAAIQGNPMIIFRNDVGYSRPFTSGAYAWGPADSIGYLTDFYWNAKSYPSEVTFGGSAKGFNDSLASWSANRFVSEQCGQTWLNSIQSAASYYSSANQLPFMMIATWNDYEEGTTIESGIDNCLSLSASATPQTLVWSLSGAGVESTVDHYTVFISSDGQNLMRLADVASGTHSLDLSAYTFDPGSYKLFVKAVGKSSLKNQMSNAAAFSTSGQGPVASLAVTPTSGTAPVTVSASTAASTSPNGTITSSKINFGDGTIVSGPVASHVYAGAGAFTVTATVTDNIGATASATATVIANAAPVAGLNASLSATPTSGYAPVTVSASTAGSTSGAGIASSTINFGDGTVVAGSTATHAYKNAGTYTVTGTVTDGSGATASKTATISVKAPVVTITKPTGTSSASPVEVAASAFSGIPIDGMWVYVDNKAVYNMQSSSLDTFLNISVGKHTIMVKAWDINGVITKASKTITVTAPTTTTPNGVVINSPTASNTARSFNINAVATDSSPNGIASIIAYMDGVEVARVYASTMNAPVTVGSGAHTLTVSAWEDVTGIMFTSVVTFTAP